MKRQMIIAVFALARLHCVAQDSGAVNDLTKDALPQGASYVGEIVEGRSWSDIVGTHFLVVTQKESGKFCEKGYRSELHGYEYIQMGIKVEAAWHIQDFGGNACSKVRLLPNTMDVTDADSDGIYETCFMYEIGHDCCDPLTVKLMLHSKGTKLAIRGKVSMVDDPEEEVKEIDSAFEGKSSRLREYASKQWDSYFERMLSK